MSITSFFSRIVRLSARDSRRHSLLQRRNTRQRLSRSQRDFAMLAAEMLEDRTLLAAFTVNIFIDELDAAHGGSDLDTGVSLREAILDANALAGADTIDLPSGTYMLSIANLAGQENLGAEGDLDITDDLTIIGGTADPGDTRVSGLGGIPLSIPDRVFHVLNGAIVEFKTLTIENGSAIDPGSPGFPPPGDHGHGGGVLVVGGSDVTFDNVDVSNNVSSWSGGGIYNELSTVNITNGSSVNNNLAVAGGGIYAVGSAGMTTNIVDSEVTNNFAIAPDQFTEALGGGIYNDGDVINITNSQITGNQAIGFDATATTSTTEGTTTSGGSGFHARGGGIYMGFSPVGEVHITAGSVVADNVAEGGDGFTGLAGDSATSSESTTAETGDNGGNGGNAYGGGLYASTGLVDISDSTFSANSAIGGAGGQGGAGGAAPFFDGIGGFGGEGGHGGEAEGGGIAVGGGALVTVAIDNSLFGMNTSSGGDGGQGGDGGAAGSTSGTISSTTLRTGGTGGSGGTGGIGGASSGGAIYTNTGTLDITNSTFTNANTSIGGSGGNGGNGGSAFFVGGEGGEGGAGGDGFGGGVGIGVSPGGPPFVNIGASTLTGNSAISGMGGAGGRGGDAGNVYTYETGSDGSTTTSLSSSGGTGGTGGAGGNAGSASGGGLFADSGTIDITDTTFDQNDATAGDGGAGGAGGDAFELGGSGGFGGEGGDAGGGGIGAFVFGVIPDLEVRRSTLVGNQANAGTGGDGGDGGSGSTSSSTFGTGGDGGMGGEATGGGLFVEGVLLSLINTTVSGNSATSANGGDGGSGENSPADPGSGGEGGAVGGGGLDVDASSFGSAINNSTITLNDNAPGLGGFEGAGGAGDQASDGDASAAGLAAFSTVLPINNTIVAQNMDNFDVSGGFSGEGNYIGSGDGAAGIFNGVDGNNIGTTGFPLDADLVPLAFNGGPTPTHHPRRTSPVIDEGVDSVIPGGVVTDQRGFTRAVDVTAAIIDFVDVGAVEVTAIDAADVTPPTFEAPRSGGVPRHTSANDISWDINFSEAVSGVDATDFQLSQAPTGVNLTNAGDADSSTYVLTATGVPEGTMDIVQIIGGSGIEDIVGNDPVQARQGSIVLHRYTVDRTDPTVAMTSTEPAITNAAMIPVTATFSEFVIGMDQSDLSVTNGTVSDFSTDNFRRVYNFNITPIANGLITVDIAAAAAQDRTGNDSLAAAQFTITSEILNVAFTRINPTPTTATTVEFNVIFTEDAFNVDPSDFVVLTTGSASGDALVTVGDAADTDDATYVVTVTGVSRHGTLGLDFTPATDIVNGNTIPVTQTPTVDEVYDIVNDVHGILSLPARTPGNVTAVISGLNLKITGDTGDNGISISANAAGDVVVAGVGGTTINGVADFTAFSGVGAELPGNLTIQSRDGRDLISVADLTMTGSLVIFGGNDVDAIDLINVNVLSDMKVFEDNGSGFIDLSGGTVTGVGLLYGGAGDNGVTVNGTAFQSLLSYNGGTGNDTVSLNSVLVNGNTQFVLRAGQDAVDLTSTDHQGPLTIFAAEGNDTITGLDVDVTARVYIDAGAGDDIVDFDDLHAFSSAILYAGADNDAVRFLNSVFDGGVNFPINAGNNVVDLQGNTFHGATTVRATAGALGVRIKNNTFNSSATAIGGPGATDVLMDNSTSSFAVTPTVSGFEDLSNTHIDELFENLLGLVF